MIPVDQSGIRREDKGSIKEHCRSESGNQRVKKSPSFNQVRFIGNFRVAQISNQKPILVEPLEIRVSKSTLFVPNAFLYPRSPIVEGIERIHPRAIKGNALCYQLVSDPAFGAMLQMFSKNTSTLIWRFQRVLCAAILFWRSIRYLKANATAVDHHAYIWFVSDFKGKCLQLKS